MNGVLLLCMSHVPPAGFVVFGRCSLPFCWHIAVWRGLTVLVILSEGEQRVPAGVTVRQTQAHICVLSLNESSVSFRGDLSDRFAYVLMSYKVVMLDHTSFSTTDKCV